MSFALSRQQSGAIRSAAEWYRNQRQHQQVFRLFGYAGTGKSTITPRVIDALGLMPMGHSSCGMGGVLYAAFAGKAALVMNRKGIPATTIHGLIYRVSETTSAEVERVEEDLANLRAGLRMMNPGS